MAAERPMRSGASGSSLNLFNLILAVVVAAAAVVGYLGYQAYVAPKPTPDRVAAQQDTVSVNYIGMFEDKTVFDTSLKDVATDNTTYRKAASFQWHATWSPFTFTIGSGQVRPVPGFENGVIGMRVGETKTLNISPAQAYGAADPKLIENRSLTEQVPLVVTISQANFTTNFSVQPSPGLSLIEPAWGWRVVVLTVSGSGVTFQRLPDIGATIRPYGAWSALVQTVDEARGVAVVVHQLKPSDANSIQVSLPGGQTAFITHVDNTIQGHFTLDRNPLVKGKNLIFQVTMVAITKVGEKP